GHVATQGTSVSISGDGKYVTYLSTGTHLLNAQYDMHPNPLSRGYRLAPNVFVYDRSSDTNYLVSRDRSSPLNAAGAPTTPGDNWCYVAVISQDGSAIAFGSISTNLQATQHVNSNDADFPGTTEQYFVANRQTGSSWATATINLVSHNTRGNDCESVTNVSG